MAALLWEIQEQHAAHTPQRIAHWVRASLGLWYHEHHAAERYAAAEHLAQRFGCSNGVTQALAANGEQWDGAGYPGELAGEAIPIVARIVSAAQTAVVWGERLPPAAVAARLMGASGGRFDPTVVRALHGILTAPLPATGGSWLDALIAQARHDVPENLRGRTIAAAKLATLFAEIVDAKSPFTASHSVRVATLAGAMTRLAGSPPEQVASTLLAGLLHDLGKLGVSNLILDKPAPLTDAEWAIMRRHPADSARVISTVPDWRTIAWWAGAHHERPDGHGYHQGLAGDDIPTTGLLLATADAFDAMTADRPYRQGLPIEEAFCRLRDGIGTHFAPQAVALLAAAVQEPHPAAGRHMASVALIHE